MKAAGALSLCLALLAGAATVFGFAPFALWALPMVTLALLLLLWQSAPTPGAAAWIGFAFGAGLFGVGASWVFIALNTFGGMPAALAAIGTAGFCAFLALYPAAVGWIAARWTRERSWQRALAAVALWPLAEWARSVVFTGFPWLSLGYAALPGGLPPALAGYAPVGGVFMVSLAMSLCAAALALAIDALAAGALGRVAAYLGTALLVVAGGEALSLIEWSTESGAPLAVSLVQGNVAQELKFDTQFAARTFDLYTELVESTRGRLVVLPESAFPMFADEVPDAVLLRIIATVVPRSGDAIIGLFTSEPALEPGGMPRYYNSVVTVGTARPQLYRKRHLVPFGEKIPLEPIVGWFIRRILAIPISSQARGDSHQQPLELAGERVAVDICYEDAFGAEIRTAAREATLLVNVTNDAWYGRSLAALQHNQIAAMRALESGRPLLRATNTGITSAIGHDGREIARLPWFTRGILEVEVVGRQGTTPYVRFGDPLAGVAAAGLLCAALLGARPKRASAPVA
ncbi:MAG TPA: apolipoprotein N-acyltransferase [Casimicrobiaceae bacterium]|nr:apolipoprotein N-acyltransferase [Casimicrobiaceae bacterium]